VSLTRGGEIFNCKAEVNEEERKDSKWGKDWETEKLEEHNNNGRRKHRLVVSAKKGGGWGSGAMGSRVKSEEKVEKTGLFWKGKKVFF